jgi:pseudouridine synthase
MRLNRYLALCGVASRRAAMGLISAGRVEVNGAVTRDPGHAVRGAQDQVLLDGEAVRPPRRWVHFAFHKPRGVVVSARDELGRTGLSSYLQRIRQRVFAVGRLDRSSEGLLLLTNHGELGHRLLHPSYGIEKMYLVNVAPRPRPWQLARMGEGVPIGLGEVSAAATVRVRRASRRGAVLRFTLTEGKKREVRRICRAVGLRVLRLRRISFAGIRLVGLGPGQHRPLAAAEIAHLETLTGLEL